jgi:hypothetical protein
MRPPRAVLEELHTADFPGRLPFLAGAKLADNVAAGLDVAVTNGAFPDPPEVVFCEFIRIHPDL